MNVCFINDSQFSENSGGVERVSSILINEFVNKGIEVICCFPSNKSTEVEICKTFYLPNINVFCSENVNYLKCLVEDHHIDIIINQSIKIDYHYLTVEVKKSTNAKLITVNHSNPEFQVKALTDKIDEIRFLEKNLIKRFLLQLKRRMMYPLSYTIRYNYLKKMHKKKYENSDCYVMLSEGYVKRVCNILGIPINRKICSISNPASILTIEGKDINKIPHEKDKIVLFVGRMVFQKRVDRLLRIWEKVEKRFPEWRLVIIGDGDMLPRMKDYARQLGLNRCFFEGKKEALQVFEKASILCMLSTHECFPMSLLEAQQFGCVPISFDSYEAVHDIIEDDKTGFLIPPFDEKCFCRQLERLMTDDLMRERMAIQAYRSVSKFQSTLIVEQWISLFQELTSAITPVNG